ncbi:hypothetical protein B0H19DRAFT_1262899 [Mycena capillaripes]|nr:hypothetical protein B0H19DRAFT_1262899 [Mycena capillaripes]
MPASASPPDTAAPILAFNKHMTSMIQILFISLLFFVDGSSHVIWRGIVNSLFMGLAKMVVGVGDEGINLQGENPLVANETNRQPDITRIRSAALVGLVMIARGEMVLIVAETAQRPNHLQS